ncbi:MAG: hypothetical protein EOP33_09290, partial [Rickettsiaceae bacterium]
MVEQSGTYDQFPQQKRPTIQHSSPILYPTATVLNPDATPFTPTQVSSALAGSQKSSSISLNMYVANVRGLRTKSHELYATTSTHVTDIYAFCETNLCQSIASSEYFDSNYNVFRKDRYEGTQSINTGGGVLTAVNSKFICDAVPLETKNNIECLCVKIVLNRNLNVYIYNAYIPPNSNALVYESHFDAIQRVHNMCTESDIVLVVGDFNINRVEWEPDYDDESNDYSNVMLPNLAHLEDRLRHTSEFIF